VPECGREFDKAVGYVQEERFWTNVACSILTGAELANELGFTEFDVSGMRDFMVEAVLKMRRRRNTETMDSQEAVEEKLTMFLKHVSQNTIVTDKAPHKGNGKGGNVGKVTLLRGMNQYARGGVAAQFVRDDALLRISCPMLETWMTDNNIAFTTFYSALQKNFTVSRDRVSLGAGAGTGVRATQERIIEFKLAEDSELHQMMIELSPSREA
jgi:hypothetical protein